MSKQYICDNCGASFVFPIEEEKFTDEHGIVHILDLCAPCKNKLITEKQKESKAFFEKLLKEKKNG